MRKLNCMLLLLAFLSRAGAEELKVKELSLLGRIEGENIVFALELSADGLKKGSELPLVQGDVAYIDAKTPAGFEVNRHGSQYVLKSRGGFFGSSRVNVLFSFASRPVKNGDWRETSFSIPAATVRKISVECDRDDLEVAFPGALDVQRRKGKDGRTIVTAFLGLGGSFAVNWKPEIRRFDSELVASCEAVTLAAASVGALRIDSVFTYRVIQGQLGRLELVLPDVNVTQVVGDNIQEWKIDRTEPGKPKLVVSLSRPEENVYRLMVESEMTLPQFPCRFELPVFTPLGVLRTSGFLMVGTDSAIKLQVSRLAGLTQIDPDSFPAQLTAEGKKSSAMVLPSRSACAYQYANVPYRMEIEADDIITSCTADSMLALSLAENDLALNATVELEIKDAPAREIMIETDADTGWTVTSISGAEVSEPDADVREENGRRTIYIPFRSAVSGTILLNIRMEKPLDKGADRFTAPAFRVVGAKSERGFIVVAGEKGTRLNPAEHTGLREVHTGSLPSAVRDAQHAFRFKNSDWSLAVSLDRTKAAVYSEAFHLVSLGEGVMYSSVAITYHITGAPVQEFTLRIPGHIRNFEFSGADIESWKRDGEFCTVRLQARIMGDFTLLTTFDRQFDYYGGETLEIGSIETCGTESEVGYIAVASHATVQPEIVGMDESAFLVNSDEIPSGYAATVNAPVIASLKYVRNPHKVTMRFLPFEREQLLGQVADYARLDTRFSRDGESITTATYFIKNASRQYLVLKLPEGVSLWTVKYIGEDGSAETVIPQESEEGIMIPVIRPRDPNSSIKLEVVYARKHGRLGLLTSGLWGLRLDAPAMPETHTAFTAWKVSVPDGFILCGHRGSLAGDEYEGRNPFINVLRVFKRMGKAMIRTDYSIRRALTHGFTGRDTAEYTGAAVLAGNDGGSPARLRLYVAPVWVGEEGSVPSMVVLAGTGTLLLLAELFRKRRSWIISAAAALIITGLIQSAGGRAAAAAACWLAVFAGLLAAGFMGGFAMLWKAAAATWCGAVKLSGRLVRRSGRKAGRHLDRSLPLEHESGGFAEVRGLWFQALVLWSVLGLGILASGSQDKVVQQERVMKEVFHVVTCPGSDRNSERSALVTSEIRFTAESALSFRILQPGSVLMDRDLNSGSLNIKGTPDGYYLKAERAGDYRIKLHYRIPVTELDGRWAMELNMPPNVRNSVKISVPEEDMDIAAAEAVLFKTENREKSTVAEAVFGPVNTALITWRPRVRKTKLEEVQFFSEVNTYAALQAGVMDFANVMRWQIAQGEIRDLKVTIPAGMSVTGIRASGVATWSFDPDKRSLDVILERPVSGDFTMTVITQIACDGLPYKAAAGVPAVIGAVRQRGAIAFAARDSMQLRIDEARGLNAMNIEDFTAACGLRDDNSGNTAAGLVIRKAYRYNQADAVYVSFSADRVPSEVRVAEAGSVSIGDERIVLATRLDLAVAKAGIFSQELILPDEYEVENLSGSDISQWDELKDGRHGVIVYFTRQITSDTSINIVAARTERGIEESLAVPRIQVTDASKHSGRMTVSAERGIRLLLETHRGIDIRKASEEGIRQAGVIIFDILRPNWELKLRTDVLSPVVKPEILQVAALTEGVLHCKNYIRCQIENAGVKSFLVKTPVPGIPVSVSGRNIARTFEVDREQGIWQVDLHSKVENVFEMNVVYQVPYNPSDRAVAVKPVELLNTLPQKGYVAVTSEGRVQVKPDALSTGLRQEDARIIPAYFGAGDLSDAVLCFGTMEPGYELRLSVLRHDAASVLPASIGSVNMTSAMSEGGQLLTKVRMSIRVGEMRLLEVELPRKNDRLWTVLVDGSEVTASRNGGRYVIPLDGEDRENEAEVEFVYAGSPSRAWPGAGLRYEAPCFGLPMRDINWNFFVMPGRRYYGFTGTMERQEYDGQTVKRFNSRTYSDYNRLIQRQSIENAKRVLDEGDRYVKAGKQRQAKRALQEAVSYSQSDADLNEDARVQYRNLVKQQVKIGLLNRRDAVRFSQNIIDEAQLGKMEGFQDGEYTSEYAEQMEESLSSKENAALEEVADRIIEQQAAAAGVVSAIRVTVPEHGSLIRFHRETHIDPEEELSVSFNVGTGAAGRITGQVIPAAAVMAVLWCLAALYRARKQAA